MSVRGNDIRGTVRRGNLYSGNCPFGEMSFGGLSIRELLSGKCLRGTVRRGKVLRGNVRWGTVRKPIWTDEWLKVSSRTATDSIIRKDNETLLKDTVGIKNIMDSNVGQDENIETLLHHVDLSRCSRKMFTLSENSREVAIYIAGYVAKKLKEHFSDCCNGLLISDSGADNPDFSYVMQSHQKFAKLCMYCLRNSRTCG